MNLRRIGVPGGLAVVALIAVLGLASVLVVDPGRVNSMGQESLPNNLPHPNPGGKAATFSTEGSVNLTGEYFQAQGTNGRSCVSCHIPEEAWSINPGTLQELFDQKNGTHPVFNTLDEQSKHGCLHAGCTTRCVQHALESWRVP